MFSRQGLKLKQGAAAIRKDISKEDIKKKILCLPGPFCNAKRVYTVFPLVRDPALKSRNNVSKNWPMFAHIIGEPNLWHILEAFHLSANEAHLKIFPKTLSDISAYFSICLRYCTISTDSMLSVLVGLQLEESCTSQLIACKQICPGNIRPK